MTRFGLDNLKEALDAKVKVIGLRPFGRLHGVQVGVIRSLLDDRDASFSNVMRLAEILDIPVGIGPKRDLTPAPSTVVDGERFDTVARYDAAGAAGDGLINFDGPPIDHLAFSKRWLEQNGISAGDSVLINVKGRSMEPGIYDGDLVMIDRRRNQIRSGRIYAFRDGEGLRIKRLMVVPDVALFLLSNNPDNPPEQKSGDAMNTISENIVGEVVWSGHKWP